MKNTSFLYVTSMLAIYGEYAILTTREFYTQRLRRIYLRLYFLIRGFDTQGPSKYLSVKQTSTLDAGASSRILKAKLP